MLKKSIAIGMAFIGVVVGAGFASGQEAVQYFVAFGNWGLVGAVVGALLMLIMGVSILQLGSYFQAKEHMAVLGNISSKIVSWILDIATVVTLFSIGFVMFAGGGSNLNQQFGWPLWIGTFLMLALVIATGFLDVDKVTTVIGALTPFILLFTISACVYTLVVSSPDWSAIDSYATSEVATTLPTWWISALNYTGLNVMCVVSMALVIGGNQFDTKAAGLGGLMGGLAYLVMLLLLVSSLYIEVETINGDDMPVLTLINEIHPVLGTLMALVIFGMVFNTAVSMFYALAKRLTRGKGEKQFRIVYVASCLIGFVLSFIGFQKLVGYVYPILGYMGLLMIVVVAAAWLRGRSKLDKEGRIRIRAMDLTRRKMDPRLRFTKRDERKLARLTAASSVANDIFEESISEEISKELAADKALPDFDPDDEPSDVVVVSHTAPVTHEEYLTTPPRDDALREDEDEISDEEFAAWEREARDEEEQRSHNDE